MREEVTNVRHARLMDADVHIMHGTLATDGTNKTLDMSKFPPLCIEEDPKDHFDSIYHDQRNIRELKVAALVKMLVKSKTCVIVSS